MQNLKVLEFKNFNYGKIIKNLNKTNFLSDFELYLLKVNGETF